MEYEARDVSNIHRSNSLDLLNISSNAMTNDRALALSRTDVELIMKTFRLVRTRQQRAGTLPIYTERELTARTPDDPLGHSGQVSTMGPDLYERTAESHNPNTKKTGRWSYCKQVICG